MYALPKLPYAYNALEPVIDAATMEIHYTKHHQTYVDKLNAALEGQVELQALAIEELLVSNAVPAEIAVAVRNHGGGHYNHSLWWESLSSLEQPPSDALRERLIGAFGSVAAFNEQFTAAATTLFGSGWVWLVQEKLGGLKIVSTANQNTPLTDGLVPLLGLDLWEHAYYLQYQNRRADYVTAWWKIVNWQTVEGRIRYT